MNCFIRNLANPFFPLHCFHCAMIIPFRKTRPLRPRCNHLLLLLLLQNLPPPTRLSLKKCAPYLRIPTPADLSTTSMLTRRRVSHDVVSVFLARHWDSCFRIERGPEKNNLVSYLFLFERVLLHFSKDCAASFFQPITCCSFRSLASDETCVTPRLRVCISFLFVSSLLHSRIPMCDVFAPTASS